MIKKQLLTIRKGNKTMTKTKTKEDTKFCKDIFLLKIYKTKNNKAKPKQTKNNQLTTTQTNR